MTTAIPTPSPAGLPGLLARHLRSIVRLDAVVTTLAGLEMVLAPALFVSLLGLGQTPAWAVRWLGAEWLLFGLWLLTLWSRPLTRGRALFAIGMLGANAALLVAAPFVFGLGYAPLGWALTIGVVAFMDLVALAWWQVLAGRAGDGA